MCALQGVARGGAVTCSAEAAARLQEANVEAGETLGDVEQLPPSSPADTAEADSPTVSVSEC